ncbi:hypothetical protein ACQY0O_006680 [Thecaphora frezii]
MAIACHEILDDLEEGDIIEWFDDEGILCQGSFLSYAHHRYIRVETDDALVCIPLELVFSVNERLINPET